MSQDIVMYIKPGCPFCKAAQRTFEGKGVRWEQIDITAEPERRDEMIERSGQRTVPQIFIGDEHVGGFDDLDALDQEGALDRMLGA